VEKLAAATLAAEISPTRVWVSLISFHAVLLSSPVPLHMRLAVVPEGGRAARQTLTGALRAALTARPFLPRVLACVMSSATENERRSTMSEIKKTQTLTVKLFGNLGSDPKLLSTNERVYTRPVYDAMIDDAVEREFRKPGRELRTFSLAVNSKDEAGNPVTRWHHCVDWQGLTATYRKGDRVSLTGFFKTRTYEKDGETKTVREFVITNAKLERMKVREQAA
jgi:single-stranded DNA-binding protein